MTYDRSANSRLRKAPGLTFALDQSDELMVYSFGENIIVEFTRNAPVDAGVHELCQVSEKSSCPAGITSRISWRRRLWRLASGLALNPFAKWRRRLPGVVHRLEYVETIDGVKYVNNSMCTNADAFEKSLQALPEPKVVIAGGVFKGGDVATLAGAVVQEQRQSAGADRALGPGN